MVAKTFPSVKIAEVPDNFIIKGFPFSVNSDLKVNGRMWVVILNAKGNEFPRTGITNLPHLFFYTTNHDKPQ